MWMHPAQAPPAGPVHAATKGASPVADGSPKCPTKKTSVICIK
jgi:hypothetical protein